LLWEEHGRDPLTPPNSSSSDRRGRPSLIVVACDLRQAGRNRARSSPEQSTSKRFFSQFITYFVIALYHEWIRRIDEDGPSTHRRRLGSPSGRPRLIELALLLIWPHIKGSPHNAFFFLRIAWYDEWIGCLYKQACEMTLLASFLFPTDSPIFYSLRFKI
jgi:hypothetical protein